MVNTIRNRFQTLLFSKPAVIVIGSFLGAIVVGTGLLMLPISTGVRDISIGEAWFTATSAVCVTGLVVVDTGTVFSGFGQAVILGLIQAGGLGIMVLTMAVILSTRHRLRIREQNLHSYTLNESDRGDLRASLKQILFITGAFEVAGAIILAIAHRSYVSPKSSETVSSIWFGLFHSVSAFCNAGFALQADSLSAFGNRIVLIFTIMSLIIAGGIGFGTLRLIRTATNRKDPLLRLVMTVTIVLIIIGSYLFYFLEFRNTLAGMTPGNKYLASLFQSVTLRTAGFNTVPIGDLRRVTLLVMVPFMFIGASSGGTAGGAKIGTMLVIFAETRRILRHEPHAVLRNRTVSSRKVSQAFILVFFGISFIAVVVTLISAFEPFNLETILFEVVSALGTVGLSTGITPELSNSSRILLTLLMIVGRVGPLTLLSALSKPGGTGSMEYPVLQIPIG